MSFEEGQLENEELSAIQKRENELLKLMHRSGFETVQENGQRKYGGPPPNWDGPPPPKGCEVFVGRIPRDVFEQELFGVFSSIGPIYELRLMMDFTGCNRGFAFVKYTNSRDALQAIHELNDYELKPRHRIGVLKSIDNCRLFVGGIPKNKSEEEIRAEMERLTEGVENVIVYSSITDKTKNRGFAFVEYVNHRAASKARRKLIPERVLLWGKEIAVDWAVPEAPVDENVMAKVRVLYVRNLNLSTTEQMLTNLFNDLGGGDVQKVKMMRDFAFVHFSRREMAQKAMDLTNHKEINGSIVEVLWAKPAHLVGRCEQSAAVESTNNKARQRTPKPTVVAQSKAPAPASRKTSLSSIASSNFSMVSSSSSQGSVPLIVPHKQEPLQSKQQPPQQQNRNRSQVTGTRTGATSPLLMMPVFNVYNPYATPSPMNVPPPGYELRPLPGELQTSLGFHQERGFSCNFNVHSFQHLSLQDSDRFRRPESGLNLNYLPFSTEYQMNDNRYTGAFVSNDLLGPHHQMTSNVIHLYNK